MKTNITLRNKTLPFVYPNELSMTFQMFHKHRRRPSYVDIGPLEYGGVYFGSYAGYSAESFVSVYHTARYHSPEDIFCNIKTFLPFCRQSVIRSVLQFLSPEQLQDFCYKCYFHMFCYSFHVCYCRIDIFEIHSQFSNVMYSDTSANEDNSFRNHIR